MSYPVIVVGVGPGSREYLLPAAEMAVAEADVLVGGSNALALFAGSGKEERQIGNNLEQILDYIETTREQQRVAVLLSGDPGFFSLLPRLQARLGRDCLRVIPGVSSLQLASARLGLDWHEICCLSVHGRDLDELARAAAHPLVAVLTGTNFPPAAVCRYFLQRGANFDRVWVLTDLGLPGEQVTEVTLTTGAEAQGRVNSVVILQRDPGVRAAAVSPEWMQLVTPGLPSELYLRSEVAMSQEEVRILTVCKAHLRRGMVVYEIGAGTGSWTVEIARLIAPGSVWAVEKNPEAARLVRANLEYFGLSNVHLVEGEAPAVCSEFPPADAILIGGSGGNLEEILKFAARQLRPGGTLVVTAVTPDTFSTAWQSLGETDWEQREAVLASMAHVSPRGRAQIWQGENPAFIIRAVRKQ